jgi:hypothetical protein
VEEAYRNVAQVVEELKAEGLNTFYYRYRFEVDGHPNRSQAARMGRELYEYIVKNGLLDARRGKIGKITRKDFHS